LFQIHTIAFDPALKTFLVYGWSGGSAPFPTLSSDDIRIAQSRTTVLFADSCSIGTVNSVMRGNHMADAQSATHVAMGSHCRLSGRMNALTDRM
jgi:hypothetical protein